MNKLFFVLMAFVANVTLADEGVVISLSAKFDGSTRYGNGVVVAKDVIATNCHIVKDSNNILILDKFYQQISAQLIYENVNYDLCLLKLEKFQNLKIAKIGEPENLRQLVYVRNGFDRNSESSIKTIYNYPHNRDGPKMLHLTDTCEFGDSGSGVFDANERLVGIIVANYTPDFTCLALPSILVRNALSEVLN